MGGTNALALASSTNNASSATATAGMVSSGNNAGLGKWYAISQAVGAMASLAGGISSIHAANQEAELQEQQANLLLAESNREAAPESAGGLPVSSRSRLINTRLPA
jgi:hypothetical protein